MYFPSSGYDNFLSVFTLCISFSICYIPSKAMNVPDQSSQTWWGMGRGGDGRRMRGGGGGDVAGTFTFQSTFWAHCCRTTPERLHVQIFGTCNSAMKMAQRILPFLANILNRYPWTHWCSKMSKRKYLFLFPDLCSLT